MYTYKATVVKVYDGDTVTVDIDLGLGVWLKGQKLRLAGINAPELRGESKEEGRRSRDGLRGMILNEDVTIKTYKDKRGKYGRWIADIYYEGVFINEWMLEQELAVIYG